MRVCVLLEDKDDFLFQIYSKPIFQTMKKYNNFFRKICEIFKL